MRMAPADRSARDRLAWEREVRALIAEMDRTVATVVVEGKRDEQALRDLGVETPIVACARTAGLLEVSRSIDGEPIAILTDYDEHGRKLNGKLRDYLPDGRVESRWRRELGLLLTQRGHYDVESLNGIADRPGWAPEEWRDDR